METNGNQHEVGHSRHTGSGNNNHSIILRLSVRVLSRLLLSSTATQLARMDFCLSIIDGVDPGIFS